VRNEDFVKVSDFWKWVHGETGFGGLEEGEVVGLASNRKRWLCLFMDSQLSVSVSVSEFSLVGVFFSS